MRANARFEAVPRLGVRQFMCRVPGAEASATLRCEAEVRERVLTIPVGDDPRHLAAPDVEQARPLCLHLAELQPARRAAPARDIQHEDTLTVELAVLHVFDPKVVPGAQKLVPASASSASPVRLNGAGPSTSTYSISGCAHSLELKSPRSQAA